MSEDLVPREQAPVGRASAPNTLTPDEKASGWRLLFDGSSTKGWHRFGGRSIPSAWTVTGGALTISRWQQGDPEENRGDIRTTDDFDNFDLRLQWAVAPGGNSGVFYLTKETLGKNSFESGPEMQILDDARHEDGLEPKHRAGAVYALYAPACHALRPIGEYNDARVLVRNGHVEHWLNGYRVAQYDLGSQDWQGRVKRSKFSKMNNFGKARKGYIVLQDHGDVVRFRNIRVRTGNLLDTVTPHGSK